MKIVNVLFLILLSVRAIGQEGVEITESKWFKISQEECDMCYKDLIHDLDSMLFEKKYRDTVKRVVSVESVKELLNVSEHEDFLNNATFLIYRVHDVTGKGNVNEYSYCVFEIGYPSDIEAKNVYDKLNVIFQRRGLKSRLLIIISPILCKKSVLLVGSMIIPGSNKVVDDLMENIKKWKP